jgi:hypothetical protein
VEVTAAESEAADEQKREGSHYSYVRHASSKRYRRCFVGAIDQHN